MVCITLPVNRPCLKEEHPGWQAKKGKVRPKGGGYMICEFCGGRTINKRVKKQHWLNGKLYIIENVEAEVCTGCGERYFHATVLDRIDQYLLIEHEVKEKVYVEVVSI